LFNLATRSFTFFKRWMIAELGTALVEEADDSGIGHGARFLSSTAGENVSPGNQISSQKVSFKKSKSDAVKDSKRCQSIQKVVSVLFRSHHCVI
jgi:hypothetical protein